MKRVDKREEDTESGPKKQRSFPESVCMYACVCAHTCVCACMCVHACACEQTLNSQAGKEEAGEMQQTQPVVSL